MKKILLALGTVALLSGSAMAETVTYEFEYDTYGIVGQTAGSNNDPYFKDGVMKNGDVTLTFSTQSGSGFRFWSDGLRCYKGASRIVVEAGGNDVVEISMEFIKTIGAVQVDGKNIALSGKVYTWTGNASQVALDLAPIANNAMISMTVNYEAAGVDRVATPTITMVEGAEGYEVVMTSEEGDIYFTEDGTEPTTSSSKYITPIPVWGKTTFKAIAAKDGKVSGVTTFVADPPTVVEDFMALYGFFDMIDSKGAAVEVRGGKYVNAYQSGSYMYLFDGMNYMLMYGTPAETYEPGAQFSKIVGTFVNYNGLAEINNYELTADGTGLVPQPMDVEYVSEIYPSMMNRYVKLTKVAVKAKASETRAADDFNAVDADGNSIVLYNRFGIDISELADATVTGFVSIYKDNVQIFPTEISLNTGLTEIGIETVSVEYYNLQGVRVANPENGIYIMRQGDKTSKVVIK